MERRVIRSVSDAAWLVYAFNWKVFALDTETTSLRWYEQKLDGMSLCDGKYTVYIPYEEELFDGLKQLIEKAACVIMHNATFDAKALYKYNINLFNAEWFDTMVADHLINENRKHGLKELASTLLGKDVVKYDEASRGGVTTQKFMEYAMNDAEWTWELAQYYKPLLREQKLEPLFRDIEMPFLKVLARMEMNGVKVDLEKVHKIKNELEETISELTTKLCDSIGEKYSMQHTLDGKLCVVTKINFNSSQQLANILFDKLGLPKEGISETDKGALQINHATLEKLKGKHVFVDLLLKYKTAQKLLTAFFEPLPEFTDKDGRVRPHYHDTGTATGRLSCSDPNLQQLPKTKKELPIATRSCFIASEGKKMIAVDYSQQELRIMTQLSQDEKLIKIIRDGGDLHLINANLVFGLGIPEEKLYETHPEYEEIKKQYKKDRDKGKVFSFGIAYGMGEHKLSRDFNTSLDEAKQLLDKFFEGYKGLDEAISRTHRDANKQLFVSTFTGRRRRFDKNQWGKVDNKSLRQSFNFLIQGYGADLIRKACIRLQEFADKKPSLGITLLMTVHDEVVVECNEDWAEYVREQAEKILEGCDPTMCVPLKAEGNIGSNYEEAK